MIASNGQPLPVTSEDAAEEESLPPLMVMEMLLL